MPRFRISLATLLGLIALIALGLAGMTSGSRLWTAVAATLTLAVLLTAILAAFLLAGSERPFWVGFALFGWTYLLLVNWDWIGGQFGHDLTASLSDIAESLVPEVGVTAPPFPASGPSSPTSALWMSRQPTANPARPVFTPVELVRQRQIKIGNLVQISRMVLSLLFAWLGGSIARALAERRAARSGAPG